MQSNDFGNVLFFIKMTFKGVFNVAFQGFEGIALNINGLPESFRRKGDGSIFSLKKELPLQHVAQRLSFHSSLIS